MERSRQERIFDLNSLRSHDRNCVRIFVFHQLYMSVLFHYEVTRVFEPTNTWRPTLLDSIIVVQIENLFLSGPFHLSKLLSFFCIRQLWTDSWIRRKKKTQRSPSGIELRSSDCRSDALTTELRSHDRDCVRTFVFHQLSVFCHYEVTQVFEPTNT